jgi:glycosyltransferase involved in cell wall biosynthesis
MAQKTGSFQEISHNYPMKVLIVSDLESTGGAAIACQRLTQGLTGLGVECVRAVGAMDGGAPGQEKFLLTQGRRLESITGLAAAFGLENVARELSNGGVRRQIRQAIAREKPDVIHLHNLHKANWDFGLVEECTAHAPVVWTLHDMWSMTGRCCYAYDCQKFTTGCDAACPTPAEYPPLAPKKIAAAWTARKTVIGTHPNLVAVGPSCWMAEQARSGLWKKNRVEVIANGLDLEAYKPMDAASAQAALGLDPHTPVVLLVADYLGERRKGGGLVNAVLAAAKTRPLQVLTLGHCPPEIRHEGIRHVHCGYIPSDLMKSVIYSAADLLLHMAPVDNLPNTVAEAIACGTPVAAHATGGVPEMVRPGQTGWLAEAFTAESFAATLDQGLQALESGAWLRPACRQFAEDHFDVRRQAAQYLALFESLLSK